MNFDLVSRNQKRSEINKASAHRYLDMIVMGDLLKQLRDNRVSRSCAGLRLSRLKRYDRPEKTCDLRHLTDCQTTFAAFDKSQISDNTAAAKAQGTTISFILA